MEEEKTKKRFHITYIKGNINGTIFTGEGKGTFNFHTYESIGSIEFRNFPGNYNPLLCHSWKCKHHPCVPFIEHLSLSLFIKRNYDLDEVILYISGGIGEIHTTGNIREIAPDTTEAFSFLKAHIVDQLIFHTQLSIEKHSHLLIMAYII